MGRLRIGEERVSSLEMTNEFLEQMSQILSDLAANLHSPRLEKTMLAHLLEILEGKDVYARPELLVAAIFRAWGEEAAADTSPEQPTQSQGGRDLMEYRKCLADGLAALANAAGVTQLVTRLVPAARGQIKEHGHDRQTCARWMTFFGVYALMTGTASTPPKHIKPMAERGLSWLFSYANPDGCGSISGTG
jgi:hypothetical protein